MAKGWEKALMNSQRPSATKVSSCWSASRHMNASLSLRRFGVIRRMSSARSRVCSGGSMVTMCSCIGTWSRWAATISVMSSPSSGTGNVAKGPMTELHDENVSVARYTSLISS